MLKLISEFLPLLVFFISYKYKGILFATFTTLIVSVIHIVVSYIVNKKLTIIQIVYSTVLLIFGSITLWTGDPSFIKMKPTIVYIIIASTIFITNKCGSPILRSLLKELVEFPHLYFWSTLSNRCSIFYLLLAIANEIIWRCFSEIIWVRFKVFIALPLISFFIISQLPFVLKNNIKKK